ncbi:hypothetical protein VTP01DRAFT_5622 [Rhizomucor pusillus]|uniref:uncharacterized protein n=1 Tax=Rhizomucor pusillus TaxID=4840 RepID=UPI0037441421
MCSIERILLSKRKALLRQQYFRASLVLQHLKIRKIYGCIVFNIMHYSSNDFEGGKEGNEGGKHENEKTSNSSRSTIGGRPPTSSWPSARKEKYHRSEIKPVNEIAFVKNFVLNRLGVLPVFFFLMVVFGQHEYAGPYNHVEKGLLILYFLLSGSSIADMSRLDGLLNGCLTGMFSMTRIRILCAQLRNPKGLKHATLLSDGHDSRASYVRRHDSARSYSYKLKKSGFRTQVCIDIKQMIVFVSDAEHCGEHNDGSMLSRIDLSHAVSKYDVIGLQL